MPLPELMDHRQVAAVLGIETGEVIEAANAEELNGEPFPRPRIVETGEDDAIILVWVAADIAKFGAPEMVGN